MRWFSALLATLALALALPAGAAAQFPYRPQGSPDDYTGYYLPPSAPVPNDLGGKLDWMYASTPAPPGPGQPVNPLTLDKRELGGVRGAWIVDRSRTAPQAWATTTGRPDVTIAVLDSGIMWNNWGKPDGQVRLKIRLNKGELPKPRADRATSTDPLVPDCAALASRAGEWDLNGDGVFNVVDYACDSRVDPSPAHGMGANDPSTGKPVLDPEDVIIAFSDGTDADGNGYSDDIAGWDFLDDDNDPFDDVQYGHGSGEIMDSGGEADNGGDLGTCPNCTVLPLRVGTSFIAEVDKFALATIYATDNGVDVVQEALGTLNKSALGLAAVKYAYDHGTTVIASAADEAAQHHNWPSSYPYAIVVNSVTHTDDTDPLTPTSYLQFNGCTNFSSRITLAIPSVSCSSDATGRSSGMAGLVYSAALNSHEQGRLGVNDRCTRVDGTPCVITPNEVRQVMASGSWDGVQAADDVNFAVDPVTGQDLDKGCGGNPLPGCTDPFAPLAAVAVPRLSAPFSYPARKGHDQFYGYGRVNMARAVGEVEPKTGAAHIPPEVELTSPGWFAFVDPSKRSFDVSGQIWERGGSYKCELYVAPGGYPKDTPAPDGDFVKLPGGLCDGTARSAAIDGKIASISVADVKALFSANAGGFSGPEGGVTGQTPNPGGNVGRPNDEAYAFVVKVVASSVGQSPVMTGSDRTQAYLHRDKDMISGFPKVLPGDVEASPVLADVDGDNRNELIVANSDGVVHAWKRDGSEVHGWPVHTDVISMHPGSPAVRSGAIGPAHGAVLASPAVGDLNHDGRLEVVVADMEDKVYVFDGRTGRLKRRLHTNEAFSGKPLHPFENVRGVDQNGNFNSELAHLHRMQHGFVASPVLADLDGDGKLDIVAAALDRHVYAWHGNGRPVAGWPVVVVDYSKLIDRKPGVDRIDPVTQRPFFDLKKAPGGDGRDQGAIVDTPAVGDINGDGKPDVVVGTNENYWKNQGNEGDLNAGGINNALYQALGAALDEANGRVYAIKSSGEPGGDPNQGDGPWLPGWPFKVGILEAGLLPLVGEGITGSPIIGAVPCQGTTRARRVGMMPAAGLAYLVNANGQSCYGRDPQAKDIPLQTEGGVAADQPLLAAVGHPAFGELAGGTALLAPTAGVLRAADVVLPEYQGGQDYLTAWDLQLPQGLIKPGWPGTVNDLQFLTGPSVADIDPSQPGQEVVEGSSHDDLQGFSSGGAKLGPSWPKLTGDWTVANPAIGSFGTRDTDPGAKLVVVDGTRNGRLSAYATGASACAPASWPRFHHDPANSGDLDRDAVPPGKPMETKLSGDRLTFRSPGDDLLCGTPKRYQVVTSTHRITPANFAAAKPVPATGGAVAAGKPATLTLSGQLDRCVAVRAVDDQGNVGLPAVVRH
jgi:hypothetical protein